MKIKKIAGIETHALQIIKDMRPMFTDLISAQSLADGMVAVFKHEDGNIYEVTVKSKAPKAPKSLYRDVGSQEFDVRQNSSNKPIQKDSGKKGKAVNPWAVCNSTSPKKENPEKFERCVMDVKEKHPIKKD